MVRVQWMLRIRKIIVYIAIFLLFLSVLLNIAYLFLNDLPNRNILFSRIATAIMKQPIQIQSITAEGFLYRPVFVFRGVLVDKIRLAELVVRIDFLQSLLKKQWLTEGVTVKHLELQVWRDQNNHFHIAQSSEVDGETKSFDALLAWVSAQPHFALLDTQIHFSDATLGVVPIQNLTVTVQNKEGWHHLVGSWVLPASGVLSASTLQFNATINAVSWDDPHATGTLFLASDQFDLSRFKMHKPIKGLSHFKMWMTYDHHAIQTVRTQFHVKTFSMDEVHMSTAEADMVWQRQQASWELSGSFSQVQIAKNDFIPGFSALAGSFRMTPTTGAMEVSGKNTVISLPSSFAIHPFSAMLFSKIQWVQKNKTWEIETHALKLDASNLHFYTHFLSTVTMWNHPALHITGMASLNGNLVDHFDASIANVAHPVLLAQGEMKTDFAHILPLLPKMDLEAKGALMCNIALKWPFSKPGAISTEGAIHLLGDDVTLPKWKLTLNNLAGSALFDDHTFSIKELQGTVMQAPIKINLTAKRKEEVLSDIFIAISGELNPHALSEKLELPFLDEIKQFVPYSAKLVMHDLNTTNFTNCWVKLYRFDLFQETWGDLTADITPTSEGALIQLNNQNILGEVIVPNQIRHPLRINLSYLYLHPKKMDNAASQSPVLNPNKIVPLDVTVRHLMIDDRNDGQLRLLTKPIQNGLDITTFRIDSPLLTLSAHGSWLKEKSEANTLLIGDLKSSNLGLLLAQRHLSSRIKEGVLSSNFSLSWPGNPSQFSVEYAVGKVNFGVKKASILQLDSNTQSNLFFGRLLNVLSFDSISHLISMNFSSLTKKGFAFNYLHGGLEFSRGVLFAENIEMNSAVADLQIQGKMSLMNQSNDLTMVVFPKVSSSLPTILGFTGGPIVGAAAWVANKLVSPAVGQIMQMHYHIGGTWEKPVVKKYG